MENLILGILVLSFALQIRNTIRYHIHFKESVERRAENEKERKEWEKGYKEWLDTGNREWLKK